MPARRLTATDTFTVETIEDGIGIASVTTYYLATSASSGVTRSTSGWTTTIQTITSTNKYLWMYEDTLYTDDTHSYTDPIIRGTYGEQGQQGKMGRNIYYAGLWWDVSGNSFVVTDYQAPYVNIGTDAAPNCKVFIGANGTHTFPNSVAGYTNAAGWESMESNFKYLITKAMFSDYANLGSSVFNGDYMFSQYVSKVAWGHEVPLEGDQYYQYVDGSDVGASNLPRTPSAPPDEDSFTNDSYSPYIYISLGSLTANVEYMFAVLFDIISSGDTITYKIAQASGDNNILNNGADYSLNYSQRNIWRYYYFKPNTNIYNVRLYFYRTGVNECYCKDAYSSPVKYRPNIYANWLKGFLYSQYGMFKNVVIQGVFNNLITEIDYNAGVNADLLIEYSHTAPDDSYTEQRVCLDVFRCGNIVRIKSLPTSLLSTDSSTKVLHIPFYVDGTDSVPAGGNFPIYNNSRTKTKLAQDGTILSTARDITPDEMRMLVGRRMVLIIEYDDSRFYYTSIRSYRAIPSNIQATSPSTAQLRSAIVYTANGQPHVTNGGLVDASVNIGHKRCVYLECRLVRNTAVNEYYYIWTNTYSDDASVDDSIDDNWQ